MASDNVAKDGAKEITRIERRMSRAIIKRTTIVASIRAVHALSVRVKYEPELIPEFLVSVDELGLLWSEFDVEDNAVLDCLTDLNRIADYSADLVPEVRALINASKAVATQCRTTVDNERSKVNLGDATPSESNSHRFISRLPEIPLPQFNGEFKNWAPFRDRFIALVDTRLGLAKIDKFYYLIGCLKDSAADAIRGIPVSADNYDLAWTTLSNRFNRPRLLATSLIETLLNAPASNHESLHELHNFVKIFDENIALLDSLEIPDLGSFILFTVAFRCLPVTSRKMFESSVSTIYPSIDDLLQFARSRIAILENVGDFRNPSYQPKSSKVFGQQFQPSKAPQPKKSHLTAMLVSKPSVVENGACPCCKGAHTLASCPQFRDSWSVEERSRWMRENRLCYNCFSSKHWSNRCHSKTRCSICSRKHHALLHIHNTKVTSDDVAPPVDIALCSSAMSPHTDSPLTVLLGTALIHVRDRSGSWQVARALVDSASQISAITVSCANRLGLQCAPWTRPVSGLAGMPVIDVKGITTCFVQPRFASEPALTVEAWVFPVITGDMPRQSLPATIKDRYSTFALADPSFHISSPVDILLGADVFSSIMDGRKVTIDDSSPSVFGSIFGWILIGSVPQSACSHACSLPVSLTVSLEGLMDKFWHVEEPTAAPLAFTEEGRCEDIFITEHQRLSSGRFAVPLPTRVPTSKMGFPESRAIAVKRFESLERKLSANAKLRSLYCNFMSEYLALGHMSVAESPGEYFIPHHAVYRPDDGDDKIRVVFDASAHGPCGPSLNQCLFQGPKLQLDIIDILTRFRVHKFVFSTDICKMYRQILILPEYRKFQHILWRSSPDEDLVDYELNTVTYGLNCAPFLALRVLKAIATTDCDGFESVRQALLQQTYVDDICVGADSVIDLMTVKNDLISILKRSGLELKKWISNSKELIDTVPEGDRLSKPLPFDATDGEGAKVLGLLWHPTGDYFKCVLRTDASPTYTKRGVLSLIARIFDPLGLFAPTVFYAKYFMQRLWKSKLSWDAPLPTDMLADWSIFVSDLPALLSLRIPRHINTVRGSPCLLLGFCDASMRGYAAVIYIRVLDAPRDSCVFLIGSKTKLAPLNTVTVPRLELNAALLLARWMSRIGAVLAPQLTIVDTFAWTDSSIVLSWLSTPHETFKIYVSNRVHQILTLLPGCHWYHVKSESNPADCASRGILPSELANSPLYWHGPTFIRDDKSSWNDKLPLIPTDELPETRPTSLTVQADDPPVEWFNTFSSFDRLVRVVARIRRFIDRCRRRDELVNAASLTRAELDAAIVPLVIESQRCHFPVLIRELSRNQSVSSKPVAQLRPFIDNDYVIRVGGRLRHSSLSYDSKHPILLCKRSHLAFLLVRRWHKITCHSGPRLLIALISRQYWIMSIRSVIHSVISKCIICVKLDGRPAPPLMADLPAARVQECRPFQNVGIDYAGPLQMRETNLRKPRTYKVYVAVFVCFAVKAVHLELVSDLSTDAFIAAFDRFVARRGLPTIIYSDCGTNFVGANKQLQKLINSREGQTALLDARPMCKWNFNPPSAPHFGGLWEAAVRSAKRLLVRVMGPHILSYEELSTVLVRIEAVLNSRPITPLSSDPHDCEALTPGHFLVGQPLLAVPPKVQLDSKLNTINRWKLLDHCHQAFWRRWSSEYLTTLQARSKWMTNAPEIRVGDMVIVVDNQTPPLNWRLGRIVALLPGPDGIVRVARVLTQTAEIIRPVVKLIVLPSQ